MTPPRTAAMAVAVAAGGAAPTPEHKRFQSLLKRIERERTRLAAWQRELPLFARLHDERVMPRRRELVALRREWAFELEQVLNSQRWPRADAQTLGELVQATALAVLQAQAADTGSGDGPDTELEALYNRHAEVPLDAEPGADELAAVRRAIEDITGMPLEPGDPEASVEELLRQAQARMAEAASEQEARDAAREARQASRRARAGATKADAAARAVSQTVREVYRKLAGALHPDRLGADADDAERALATERMQRANAAYEAGDLLALLELQLQIEQVDAAHVAGIAAAQVRHFNRVLAEQLREIEREVAEREALFRHTYGLAAGRVDPERLPGLIAEELRAIEAAMRRIAYDRRTVSGPPSGVRGFLKAWRAEQRLREQMQSLRASP